MAEESVLVLAAGLARRMGQAKLARVWAGRPLLAWTVRRIQELLPGLETVLVVPPAGPVLEAALALSAERVINPEPEAGLGRSLAVGLAHLKADAAWVFLGDQPEISAHGVEAVRQARGAGVVLPRYRGVPGHPVYVTRAVWPAFLGLSGDRGIRAGLGLLPPGAWREVDVDEPAPADLDTEEDWRRWTERMATRGG
jgi:molybdenum cofactor cytidylyltransferase